MPTGMGGGADADAPPIGEFWMMDGEGGSSGESLRLVVLVGLRLPSIPVY